MKQATDTILSAALHETRLDEGQLEALASADSQDAAAVLAAACVLNRFCNGEVVTWSVGRTACCAQSCQFPSPAAAPSKGPIRPADDIVSAIAAAPSSEVLICGADNPKAALSYLKDLFARVKKAFPALVIRAAGPVEAEALAASAGSSVDSILSELREAGLGAVFATLPAPATSDDNAALSGSGISRSRWTEVVTAAARLRIPVTVAPVIDASTTPADWVRILALVRGIQESSHAFVDLSPLVAPGDAPRPSDEAVAQLSLFFASARLYLGRRLPSISFVWDGADVALARTAVLSGVNHVTIADYASRPAPFDAAQAAASLTEALRACGRKVRAPRYLSR